MTADPVATLTALAVWFREIAWQPVGDFDPQSFGGNTALAKHVDGVIARASAIRVCDSTRYDVRELLAVAEALRIKP